MTTTGGPGQLTYIGELDQRTGRVMISREAMQFIRDVWRRTGGDVDDVEAATNTSTQFIGNPTSFVWNTDPAGVFPPGNPTRDSEGTFLDPNGVELATRTMRATLTSSNGAINITEVSNTGEATTYAIIDNGTASARVDITHTNTGTKGSLAWTAVDLSTAGGTPTSGGEK